MGRILAAFPAALLLAITFVQLRRLSKREPLPPGPPGSLLFGNAFELRRVKYLWLKLAEYAKVYGPIFTIRVPISPVMIISDIELVTELFEKRSNNFSNRPVIEMANMIGWGDRVILTQYNQRLRWYRKQLHRALNAQTAPTYQEIQLYEVKRLMKRLLEDPDHFTGHVRLMVGSISLRIAYGYAVQTPDDPLIASSEQVISAVIQATKPGRWLVETIPLLRFIPSWFPGAHFKRQAKEWAKTSTEHRREPFDYVVENMARGTAEASLVSKLLEPEDGAEVSMDEKEMIKPLATALYDGGIDTTSSLVQSFLLAMTIHPEIQQRAQKEIEGLFQTNDEDARTFTISDRAGLPYCKALINEVLRWHPTTNIAVHNSGPKEEVVLGYRIPAGTMVIANIWALLHDSAVYTDPLTFNPDRFLGDQPEPDPAMYAFGFGRRSCPGVHLAQQLLWLTIGNLLANFTVSKARDELGNEITPVEDYTTSSVLSSPMPFKCSIKPRYDSFPTGFHET